MIPRFYRAVCKSRERPPKTAQGQTRFIRRCRLNVRFARKRTRNGSSCSATTDQRLHATHRRQPTPPRRNRTPAL